MNRLEETYAKLDRALGEAETAADERRDITIAVDSVRTFALASIALELRELRLARPVFDWMKTSPADVDVMTVDCSLGGNTSWPMGARVEQLRGGTRIGSEKVIDDRGTLAAPFTVKAGDVIRVERDG